MVVEYKCEKDFLNAPDFWVEVVWKSGRAASDIVLWTCGCHSELRGILVVLEQRMFVLLRISQILEPFSAMCSV